MRKKIEWEWEKLDESTKRVKVVGGWLILHLTNLSIQGKINGISQSESMQFIADRDHEWDIAPSFNPSLLNLKTPKPEDFSV